MNRVMFPLRISIGQRERISLPVTAQINDGNMVRALVGFNSRSVTDGRIEIKTFEGERTPYKGFFISEMIKPVATPKVADFEIGQELVERIVRQGIAPEEQSSGQKAREAILASISDEDELSTLEEPRLGGLVNELFKGNGTAKTAGVSLKYSFGQGTARTGVLPDEYAETIEESGAVKERKPKPALIYPDITLKIVTPPHDGQNYSGKDQLARSLTVEGIYLERQANAKLKDKAAAYEEGQSAFNKTLMPSRVQEDEIQAPYAERLVLREEEIIPGLKGEVPVYKMDEQFFTNIAARTGEVTDEAYNILEHPIPGGHREYPVKVPAKDSAPATDPLQEFAAKGLNPDVTITEDQFNQVFYHLGVAARKEVGLWKRDHKKDTVPPAPADAIAKCIRYAYNRVLMKANPSEYETYDRIIHLVRWMGQRAIVETEANPDLTGIDVVATWMGLIQKYLFIHFKRKNMGERYFLEDINPKL